MAPGRRAAAPGGAKRSRVLAGGLSGGELQGDGVAEGLEPGYQAAGFSFGVEAAGEVVGAELVVGFAGGQDVPDADQQRMGHDDDRFLLGGGAAVAAPLHHMPVVERLEVAVVADRGPGRLDQDRLQVRVAVAAPAVAGPAVAALAS